MKRVKTRNQRKRAFKDACLTALMVLLLVAVAVLAIIPALLMLVGLVELISERIQKLDYILPKARVYRGFGALSLGGITGAAVALIGIVYALIVGTGEDIGYLYIMLAGGVLCAVFAGLCFKRYKKMPEA